MEPVTPAVIVERTREALAACWPEEVAVEATIVAVSPSRSASLFLRLDAPTRLPAVCPPPVARPLLRAVGGRDRLVGTRLTLTGRIVVWEGHQVELLVASFGALAGRVEVDPEWAALADRLAAEGIFDLQRRLPLPAAPLAVAVVGPTGNGVDDALAVLRSSPWAIHVRHVDAPSTDAGWIVQALAAAARGSDVILLVRGGGDMSGTAYDAEVVVRAVAGSPVPVVAGVGHVADRSLADRAAAVSVPTPTAAARWVTDRLARFDAALDAAARRARDAADRRTAAESALRVEAAGRRAAAESEAAETAVRDAAVTVASAQRHAATARHVAAAVTVLLVVLVVVVLAL